MTEATLSIANPDEVLTLFGPRDQHLRKMRNLFGVTITHRGGQIRVSGAGDDVRRATRTLERLRQVSRKKGTLSLSDVEAAAGEEGASVAGPLPPANGQEIETRQAGRKISPRTPGQKRYVDAIRSLDLTF